MRIHSSDEKFFDIHSGYSPQKNRVNADKNNGIKQRGEFSQKVVAWLGVCFKGVTCLVILNN